MKRVVEYLKLRLRSPRVVQESPAEFLLDIHNKACIDQETMRFYSFILLKSPLFFIVFIMFSFASERLTSLFRTLKIPDLEVMLPLVTLSHFVTLVSTYKKGYLTFKSDFRKFKIFLKSLPSRFTIIIEPSEDQATNVMATYDSTLFFR